MRTTCFNPRLTVLLLALPLAAVSHSATVVWNGASVTFAKAAFANFALIDNQDRITDTVWLTRGNSQGIFNIHSETGFTHALSPTGTGWAFGTTANYNTLTYTDWDTWAGHNPPGTVGQDAVVHIVNGIDDIYLDLKFTSWGGAASGGGFSYTRSTAPIPESGSFAMLGFGAAFLFSRRRR